MHEIREKEEEKEAHFCVGYDYGVGSSLAPNTVYLQRNRTILFFYYL